MSFSKFEVIPYILQCGEPCLSTDSLNNVTKGGKTLKIRQKNGKIWISFIMFMMMWTGKVGAKVCTCMQTAT